jgi:hypothetical protein
MGAVTTLAQVRASRSPFPADLLPECESALMLFCAAFYGRNDCVWVQEAELRIVTGVDQDREKLDAMRAIYPETWRFACADAFEFHTVPHDLVSVDVFSNQSDRALGMLEHWCGMARRFVTVAAWKEPDVQIPVGWQRRDLMYRSSFLGGCYWYVLERT